MHLEDSDQPPTLSPLPEPPDKLSQSKDLGPEQAPGDPQLLRQLLQLVSALNGRVEKLERALATRAAPAGEPRPVAPEPPPRPAQNVPLSVPLPPMSSVGPSFGRSAISRSRGRVAPRPTILYRTDPRAETSESSGTCGEPGCGRPARSRGLCSMHYQRHRYRERKIENKQQDAGVLPPMPPPPAHKNLQRERREGGTVGVFALLYEEKGRKALSGLINQLRQDRTDLVDRVNALYAGMPGVPLEEEDVVRAVQYHKLGDALTKREGEIICRNLNKQRGSLVKTAQKMRIEPDQLKRRIEDLKVGAEVDRIRAGFCEEVLQRGNFKSWLDLALTREKYLEDLGIAKQVDESLKQELDQQIARLGGVTAGLEAMTALRQALELDDERYQRLLRRFGFMPAEAPAPAEAPEPAAPVAPAQEEG